MAENNSAILIDALPPERAVARQNYEKIRTVCRSLLQGKKPYLPTAKLVAEEGGIVDSLFPSERTIFNTYSDMLKIWRDAYRAMADICADAAISVEDLDKVDLPDADAGTRFILEEMRRHILEVHQRNNNLKRLITENVPVVADSLSPTSGAVIDKLERWHIKMEEGLFALDDGGLKVSRKTPVGTHIMDAGLYQDLRILVADFRSSEKAQKGSNDN